MPLSNFALPDEQLLTLPARSGANPPEVRVFHKDLQVDLLSVRSPDLDLTLCECFYIQSKKYYEERFGFPLLELPPEVLAGKEYRSVSMERALHLFETYNLSPHDVPLFPFALLLDSLPLPPEVTATKTPRGTEYYFRGHKVENCYPPGHLYVVDVISYLKSQGKLIKGRKALKMDYSEIFPPGLERTFYDAIGRRARESDWQQCYKAYLAKEKDPFGLLKPNVGNQDRSPYQSVDEPPQDPTKKNPVKQTDLDKKYNKKERLFINSLMFKRYGYDLLSELDSSKLVL